MKLFRVGHNLSVLVLVLMLNWAGYLDGWDQWLAPQKLFGLYLNKH